MGLTSRTLRPDAIVQRDGSLHHEVEVTVENGVITAIRPWSQQDREEAGCILSPAFVNAHSHLEYYDLLGKLADREYWDWIRELTRVKPLREMADVQDGATLAAQKNRSVGVAALGETSDWPVSGIAMATARLQGRIFQEIITVREWDSPTERLDLRKEWAAKQSAESGLPVHLSPHASYTVSPDVMKSIAASGDPQSIHVAESKFENEAFLLGTGPIAELLAAWSIDFRPAGTTALGYLDMIGCLHERTQIVHACSFTSEDVQLAAKRGVSIAHCPRSNIRLGCEAAPIAQLRRKGVRVGIGMDSAASSGDIDMFAEMRAAIEVSQSLGDPLTPEDVWRMATSEGAESLWLSRDWSIETGNAPPLVLVRDSISLAHAIESGASVEVITD